MSIESVTNNGLTWINIQKPTHYEELLKENSKVVSVKCFARKPISIYHLAEIAKERLE
jgi:hypothetical protein